MAPGAPYRGRDIAVPDADLTVFQRLHNAVQEAWTRADLAALGRLMTPQMLGHFQEELARNTQSGLRNVVGDVRLVNGELTEGWEEGDLQYATARLRWTALDYVVRLGRQPSDPDFLVSGNPREPVPAEEVWTFVRRAGSGWIVSAIQQV
jgi:predicted lipid-binding transport protein (Tim44 family)